MNALIENISLLHTTALGMERIKRNLKIDTDDPVQWCRERILSRAAMIQRRGKNWHIEAEGCVITVHAGRYTIITAHKAE